MSPNRADLPLAMQLQVAVQAVWRWRYRDPASGERVDHSDLLSVDEVRAIDPLAELIPGSRVQLLRARPRRLVLRR